MNDELAAELLWVLMDRLPRSLFVGGYPVYRASDEKPHVIHIVDRRRMVRAFCYHGGGRILPSDGRAVSNDDTRRNLWLVGDRQMGQLTEKRRWNSIHGRKELIDKFEMIAPR